ncbi:hypothetical protein [Nonomuraea sp. KM90]|uniref:hypothetical protein n=1 Tax=Nonomuraea sp. KM90 TaxID=3457428 RepID=UPI003FCC2F7D
MADKTIAVDFDGVIHRYSQGWHDGTIYDAPIAGALDGLRALMEHYAVFVHTTRSAGEAAEWLAGCGFDVATDDTCGRCLGAGGRAEPIDGQPGAWDVEDPCGDCEGSGLLTFWTRRDALLITNRKPPAVAYLDDRGVRFTSWGQALRDLLPDAARDARRERAERALLEAWPDLDGVFAEQAVHVMLEALEADRG